MPKVTHVKKARKDNSVCKVGESYYWWKFRFGGKHFSLTYPRPSQLTQSDFLSQMYGFEEHLGDLSIDTVDDLQMEIESMVEEIRNLGEEQEEKLQNMPEGLQEGPIGELLQSRYDECETMADELEQIDFDDYDGPKWNSKDDQPEEFTNWLSGKVDEVQGINYNGE